MTCDFVALCFDANDPAALARFWSGLLGRELLEDPEGGIILPPSGDNGFGIRFRPTQEQKAGQNRAHFDLTSASLEEQRQTVARALELGGQQIDVGQLPEEEHVVLADPEGNEFCVIEPGNNFLAGCGFIGALAGDGTAQLGYFWSAALGWPLVWDQDEETAIQAPDGGPKITWGGPPLMPRTHKDRLYFDIAPPASGDWNAEVDRLVSLGATRLESHTETRQGETGWLSMADPDGNEFRVLVA